jgi:hypothetical protein
VFSGPLLIAIWRPEFESPKEISGFILGVSIRYHLDGDRTLGAEMVVMSFEATPAEPSPPLSGDCGAWRS